MVVKISRVPLNRFCSNSQGLCKKVLSSEARELFFKKKFSFYLQKTDGKKIQISNKIWNTCHLPWLLQEALRKTDFQFKLQDFAIFGYFYFKIIWKLLQ